MIASVYIKDGNIHIYNEKNSLSGAGGIAYELGRPLLDFVCYEPEQFDAAFYMMAEAFNNEHAHEVVNTPDFTEFITESMTEMQQREVYVFFYSHIFYDFIKKFVDSPKAAVEELTKQLPHSKEDIADRISWAFDFNYPKTNSPFVTVAYFRDKEKRLFQAVKDVIAIMSAHFRTFQKVIIHEIEILLHYRKEIEVPPGRSIDYVDILDEYHVIKFGRNFYLEHPFITFYGRVATNEIEQLYEIKYIEDLFRFEFFKMMEYDIFIKKCKNCERFFIPKRRAEVEYCERIYADTKRKCSEIGAMLRYEKKVSENPILEAYKRAYRRLHSRTRTKKMTTGDFLKWLDKANCKRDECLAGELPFDEFVAWLEQGRVRKSRNKN